LAQIFLESIVPQMVPLILASQSPRRREILSFFSYPFTTIASSFDELSIPFTGDPIAYAKILAESKAASLAERFPEALLLSADTVVFKEGRLFNKPADEKEAFSMLSELNGSWHSVFTAMTVQRGVGALQRRVTAYEETRVLFHQLSPRELALYHKTFDGTDKAGGYGIQQGGALIVKKIEGCFYNVMGLPLATCRQLLAEMGIDLWYYLASSQPS